MPRDHDRGFELPDPAPLPQQLVALGPEVLGQVHVLEVLGQRPDAIGGDRDEPVVRVHEHRDQAVAVTGRAHPADPRLQLALLAFEHLQVGHLELAGDDLRIRGFGLEAVHVGGALRPRDEALGV